MATQQVKAMGRAAKDTAQAGIARARDVAEKGKQGVQSGIQRAQEIGAKGKQTVTDGAAEAKKQAMDPKLQAQAKDAVAEALDPKVIVARITLVVVPALLMMSFRLGCYLEGGSGTHSGCAVLAIQPRTLKGLLGIPLAPFVHLTNAQLFANLGGWLAMAPGLTAYGSDVFVFAFGPVTIISSSCVWLFGRGGVLHCGASGVLFGIFGFHMSILPFRRPVHWQDVASFLIFDLGYGGIWFFTVFRSPGATWELSLFGFLAGVFFAYLYFAKFHESIQEGKDAMNENMPLLAKPLLAAEEGVEYAVDEVADSGAQKVWAGYDVAKQKAEEEARNRGYYGATTTPEQQSGKKLTRADSSWRNGAAKPSPRAEQQNVQQSPTAGRLEGAGFRIPRPSGQ